MYEDNNIRIRKFSKNCSLAKLVGQNIYQTDGVGHFWFDKPIKQEKSTYLTKPKDVLVFNLDKILDWMAIKLLLKLLTPSFTRTMNDYKLGLNITRRVGVTSS